MEWKDDRNTFDTLQAKDVVPPVGTDLLNIPNQTECAALFKGRLYNVIVISSGK